MDKKQITATNKAYDILYDINSKYRIFGDELEAIERYMRDRGYKVKINSYDKCIFIRRTKEEIGTELKELEKIKDPCPIMLVSINLLRLLLLKK